jgi:Transposase
MTSRGAEKMNNDTIGVDVSKDHLDADRLADGASRRFANDQCGRKAFVKWFAQTPVQRVVFEPTGPYHRAFERALGAAGVPFVKVNPRQARRFAEAIGKLAKTDRLDAAMLARMGAMILAAIDVAEGGPPKSGRVPSSEKGKGLPPEYQSEIGRGLAGARETRVVWTIP